MLPSGWGYCWVITCVPCATVSIFLKITSSPRSWHTEICTQVGLGFSILAGSPKNRGDQLVRWSRLAD